MSLSAALSLSLVIVASTGPVDVVVSRRVDVDSARSDVLARDVSRALVAQKITGVRSPEETQAKVAELQLPLPASCNAKRSCVKGLGVALGSRVLISIDVGRVADRLAVSLEAVAPMDEPGRVAQRTFTAAAVGDEAAIAGALDEFAAEVAERLRPSPNPAALPPPDAPRVDVADNLRPSPVPGYLLAGGAAATGIAAVTFGVLGLSDARRVSSARYDSEAGPASRLTQDEAAALTSSANTRLAVGVGCTAATLLLSGLAWSTWAGEADGPPKENK